MSLDLILVSSSSTFLHTSIVELGSNDFGGSKGSSICGESWFPSPLWIFTLFSSTSNSFFCNSSFQSQSLLPPCCLLPCSLAINPCLCFLDSAVLYSFLCLPLQRLLHISYQSFPAFLSYYHLPHLFQSSYNGSHSFNNTSNSKDMSLDTNLIETNNMINWNCWK